jgi:hypothetical protein
MRHVPDPSELSRREFIRRGAIAGVGAAVAATAYGAGLRKSAAEVGRGIPTLETPGQVSGVASVADLLVAVGSLDHQAAVWIHALGDPSWSLSATGRSFPQGTVLAAAAGVSDGFVAVGHTNELSRVDVIIDDGTGLPVRLPVYGSIPAIFFSGDGSVWHQVQRAAPDADLGALGAVAVLEDGRVLAIGHRSLEPGVGGPYGLIAMESDDGRAWTAADLPDVVPPRHGSVTLLASIDGSAVLATRGIRETGLYRSARHGWKRIDPPAERVTYKAAGPVAGTFLLAGVDDLARPRVWKRTGKSWSEVHRLAGLPQGASVVDLARVGDSLVAASQHDGRSSVTEVKL